MSYLQPSNKKGKRDIRHTLIGAAVVCLLVAVALIFPRFLFGVSSAAFTPFWKFQSYVGERFRYSLELVRSKDSLIRENESLKRKDLLSESTALSLDDALSQNASLKEILGRTDSFKNVLGVIVRKPPYSPYDTLLIDIGANNGIEVGDRVFAPDNVLLGDIVEVSGRNAKVSLFSTPGRETPVVVGAKNVEAVAIGKGGGNFSVNLPAGAGIELGDTIKAPALGVSIMGVVENVTVDQSESLKSILFKSPFNIHDLYFIEVETKNNPATTHAPNNL